jgi:hypothetical protein
LFPGNRFHDEYQTFRISVILTLKANPNVEETPGEDDAKDQLRVYARRAIDRHHHCLRPRRYCNSENVAGNPIR